MSTGNRNLAVVGEGVFAESLRAALHGASIDSAGPEVARVVVWLGDDPPALNGLSPIVVVAGNDSDRRASALRKTSGLPRTHVLGLGTLPATLHFGRAIARRLRIDPRAVHAHVVGGASPGQFIPLWSSASVAGIPLHKWAVPGHGRLTVFDRTDIFEGVKSTATHTDDTAIEAIVAVARAIVDDQNRILPVSTSITGRYGIDDITLSLPCILNSTGAEMPLEVPLNDAELAGLQRVAAESRFDGSATA